MDTIYRELEMWKKKHTEIAIELKRERAIEKLTNEKDFFKKNSIRLDANMKDT